MKPLYDPEHYNYVVRDNVCLFQKGPLSQWWGGFNGQVGGFVANCVRFNCAEQYMMWRKAQMVRDTLTANMILSTVSPKKQQELGRAVRGFNAEAWDAIKYEVVVLGSYYKFVQNKHLLDWVDQHFNSLTIFAEAAPWDTVWGIGLGPTDPQAADPKNWRGTNLLGRAITEALSWIRTDASEDIPINYTCFGCVDSHRGCLYAYAVNNRNGNCIASNQNK